MTPKEEEEHTRCERDAHAHSMAIIEGAQDLVAAMKQLQIVAQRNEEMMMADWYR